MPKGYLFLDKYCLSCVQIRFDLREDRYRNWKERFVLVDVEGETAYIEGKDCGQVPVSRMPALYFPLSEDIIYGYNEIMERIKDGSICVKNKS